jgi:CRISPR-associated protein Cas2
MSRQTQRIVASYDIHNPKRLVRVAKAMKNYGERVLKSVFECNLSEQQFMQMKDRIDGILDHTEDSVRFYFLCGKCLRNIEHAGQGRGFVEDKEFVIL